MTSSSPLQPKLQPDFQGRLQVLSRFFGWWGRELRSLFPSRLSGDVRGGRHLVVAVGPDGPRLFDERGTKIRELTRGLDAFTREAEIDAILAQQAKANKARIVLRLPFETVFARNVTLPASAIADVSRIMALDLERATPFRRRDVMAAHYRLSDATAPGKIMLRQLVLKRDRLAEAQSILATHRLTLDRVDCWDETGKSPLPIDFLSWDRPAGVGTKTRTNKLLAATACVLALSGALVAATRLESAGATLDEQVKLARTKLSALEADRKSKILSQDRVAALVALKNAEMSRAVLIDKLTALLPDTDYLTSLRIEDNDVELSGFSASTAALVPLIERSKVLSAAALTSPVVFDERAQRERFTLKARIAGTTADTAATAGKGG